MTPAPILFFNPNWSFLDLVGQIAAGGKIYFQDADDPELAKPVYQDFELQTEWPNPIILDATGKQDQDGNWYPIWGTNDGAYYVRVEAANGDTIIEMTGYPDPNSGTPTLNETDIQNYIINPQFYLSYAKVINTTGDTGFNNLQAAVLPIAPGPWLFQKDNTTSTNDIVYVTTFNPGQTQVPNNPKAYIRYFAGTPGTGETIKRFYYVFNSVRQFANETINLQFYGISPYSNQVIVSTIQNFGTNGSSQVVTQIGGVNLTPSWSNYQTVIEVPSISAKNIDPNGGDYLAIAIDLPLNAICDVSFTNFCIRFGGTLNVIPFQEESVDVTTEQSAALALPVVTTINPADGCYDPILLKGQTSMSWIARAGIMPDWSNNIAPSWALLCNGLMYFSQDYYNLANVCFDTSQNDNLTIGQLVWGTGLAGFVADATAVVTSTNSVNGAVAVSAADFNSKYGVIQTQAGSVSTPGITTIICRTGADTINSSYFILNSATTGFYVWFDLNSTGVDPTPAGRTAVHITYTGNETAAQMGAKLVAGITTNITSTTANTGVIGICYSDGVVTPIADNNTTIQLVQISAGASNLPGIVGMVAVAGSSIVNGSYMTFESPTQEYYLWFAKNNLTQDPSGLPALSGKKGIKVVYTGSETATQMAALIAQQVSCAQFRVPDVRGLFPRYWQAGAGAVLPTPSQIIITSTGNDTAVNFVITGLNSVGNVISETLAGSNGGQATSVNTYAAITSIQPSAATAGSGVTAGINGEAILPAPDYITIYSLGSDESGRTFTITGTDYQGNPLTVSVAGPTTNGQAGTSALFSSVLSITPNLTTVGSLSVGTPGSGIKTVICLSQTGTALTPLLLNGAYSSLNGIATLQAGSSLDPLILDGIYGRDPDYLGRISLYNNGTLQSATGDNTGSYQSDIVGGHMHAPGNGVGFNFYTDSTSNSSVDPGSGTGGKAATTSETGGSETRGQNINLNKIICY